MITIDADTLRERIRERSDESGWQICPACESGLSEDDLAEEYCSNCGTGLDAGGESVEEHLYDD